MCIIHSVKRRLTLYIVKDKIAYEHVRTYVHTYTRWLYGQFML